MTLTPAQFLNGISSLIIVIIYSYVGLRIAFKYKTTKQANYLYIGLTWIGVVEAYYAVSISFIVSWFNGNGLLNFPEIYFVIGLTLYPVSTLIWITGFTYFFLEDRRKLLQIIFLITGILFEIVFFYLLLTSVSSIGTLLSPVDSQYALIVRLYVLFSLAVIFVTGVFIAIKSIKSNEIQYKLRGFFLLITLLTFVFGAIFDASVELDVFWLTIIRGLLVLSALSFYVAFIMPSWVLNRFKKS